MATDTPHHDQTKRVNIFVVVLLLSFFFCQHFPRYFQGGGSGGGPLKSKFTQYSPNSAAHCRDCQSRIVEGDVRVGAHVFSSSSRHAGFSINYWYYYCVSFSFSLSSHFLLSPSPLIFFLSDLFFNLPSFRVSILIGSM